MITKNDVENSEETAVIEKDHVPGMYNVVFHNDDYTPVGFVELVLIEIFLKSYDDATRLTSEIDLKGRGIVGTFSKEVATMKMKKTEEMAIAEDFPLMVTIEENI